VLESRPLSYRLKKEGGGKGEGGNWLPCEVPPLLTQTILRLNQRLPLLGLGHNPLYLIGG
jgi:hypothetical protein